MAKEELEHEVVCWFATLVVNGALPITEVPTLYRECVRTECYRALDEAASRETVIHNSVWKPEPKQPPFETAFYDLLWGLFPGLVMNDSQKETFDKFVAEHKPKPEVEAS